MTSAQRWALVIGAFVTAIVLHFSVCRWHSGGDVSRSYPLILGWHGDAAAVNRGESPTYGMVGKAEQPYPQIFGILLPLALVTIASYMILGGIPDARRRRGACPQCGHNLQFKFEAGCPECGWRRA